MHRLQRNMNRASATQATGVDIFALESGELRPTPGVVDRVINGLGVEDYGFMEDLRKAADRDVAAKHVEMEERADV